MAAAAPLAKGIFLYLLWLVISLPAFAMSVLPLTLDEIIADAKIAFQGTCVANRTGRDPQTGLGVTYTTFEVQDVLKGGAEAVHTIKQVGGQMGDDNYRIEGVPAFAVGQDYIVFLYGVSNDGFSSPVGLSQGQFFIRAGLSGQEISNGRDFREMLPKHTAQGLSQATLNKIQQASGAVKYLGIDEFKQIVRWPGRGAE